MSDPDSAFRTSHFYHRIFTPVHRLSPLFHGFYKEARKARRGLKVNRMDRMGKPLLFNLQSAI